MQKVKKTLAIILSGLLVGGNIIPPAESINLPNSKDALRVSAEDTDTILLGDANMDGKINIIDIVSIRKIFLSIEAGLAPWEIYDIDQNGSFDLMDLISFQKIYLGMMDHSLIKFDHTLPEETGEFMIEASRFFINEHGEKVIAIAISENNVSGGVSAFSFDVTVNGKQAIYYTTSSSEKIGDTPLLGDAMSNPETGKVFAIAYLLFMGEVLDFSPERFEPGLEIVYVILDSEKTNTTDFEIKVENCIFVNDSEKKIYKMANTSFSAEFTLEEIEYSVNDDDTVTFERYNGIDTEFVIPDTIDGKKVTNIGASALSKCTALTSITIPDSVVSIQ